MIFHRVNTSFKLFGEINLEAKDITNIKEKILFSVCTLVTNREEYKDMLTSFQNAGFNESNSEFLYINNSEKNQFDAFKGIRHFLTHARGQFIILCHQDILLQYDNIKVLLKCLNDLELLDPNWAILGNSGGVSFNKLALRISDPHGYNQYIGTFPIKVTSLDENFLLLKKEANLSISNDIDGFHLYGTDLCIIADILGYTAYAINFHLYHKSGGNADYSFFTVLNKMQNKYRIALRSRRIQTTCIGFYLSNSKLLIRIMESKIIKSILKRKQN